MGGRSSAHREPGSVEWFLETCQFASKNKNLRETKSIVLLYFAIVVLFLLTTMLCLVTSPNADNEPVLEKSLYGYMNDINVNCFSPF